MGSIVQGITGFMGQRQTNEMQQEDFISNQQFSAAQAALNRQFQDTEQTKAEQWMTNMSDTAMQRRVSDLKASGLNPMLAIGQGGASTPGISAPGGAMGQGSGIPNLQNPAAIGLQNYNSAKLASAQAELADAQSKKVTSETPNETGEPAIDPETGEINVRDATHALGNAQVKNIMSTTGVNIQQAMQIGANIKQIMANIDNTNMDTVLKNAQAALAGSNNSVIQGTLKGVIAIANADAQMKSLEADAFKNMSVAERNKYLGPVIGTIQSLLGPISSAVGVAKGTSMLPLQTVK